MVISFYICSISLQLKINKLKISSIEIYCCFNSHYTSNVNKKRELTQIWFPTLYKPSREPGTMIIPWPTPENVAFRMFLILVIDDFVACSGAMDHALPTCQVALHKHQDRPCAPGFIMRVLSLFVISGCIATYPYVTSSP